MFAHGSRVLIAGTQVDQHDHAEHILHDALGHVLNVDVQFCAHGADLGHDTHGVLPDNGDDSFHG